MIRCTIYGYLNLCWSEEITLLLDLRPYICFKRKRDILKILWKNSIHWRWERDKSRISARAHDTKYTRPQPCLTQWNQAMPTGQPKTGGSWWRGLAQWEGNGKPLQYSCLENPMNKMKRQNDSILKEELPRSVGAQYATGDQWRNNSRKNEGMNQSKNNTQLWMWLVIEARSDAVKSNIA